MSENIKKKAAILFQKFIKHGDFEITSSKNPKVRTEYGIHYHLYAFDCNSEMTYSVYIHTLTEDGFVMKA